jgi:FlaA1/EpsC-like NDP-sugar epimerase
VAALSAVPPTSGTALDRAVVRRDQSLFSADLQVAQATVKDRVRGARVLIVGGAGSIGSATTRALLAYQPASVDLVDQNENYLADFVRDLRASGDELSKIKFRALPLDYGGGVMRRLLAEAPPFDLVLNFAAMKHVRSEKDVYSLLQMLEVNLVRHRRFLDWLHDYGDAPRYLAVSTDKAANPTSAMGASKRLMEDLIFARPVGAGTVTTSARFANVAFSNGSLLQSALFRLARRQPLATPRDTARYFLTQREAGELCLLAAIAVPDRHIAVPRLDPAVELQSLEAIAVRILDHFGFEACCYDDEDAARRDVEKLAGQGRWPLLLTPRNTSGEKAFEEFAGDGETLVDIGMTNVGAVSHRPTDAAMLGLFDRFEHLVDSAGTPVEKAEIIAVIRQALPNFDHVETGNDLDQRF